ncbi:MAG: HAMP domain-containing protein, partial [Chloroflexi bacterium]|nr:HAMP domain-containing protein [Chloroflexota bacterium]
MAGRIVGMISVLTLVGVVAAAAVLLRLALDSEKDSGRQTAKVLSEAVARWLVANDVESLADAEIAEMLRVQAPSAADSEAAGVELGTIWVFNSQARLAASSSDARTIDRAEILSARRVLDPGTETVIEALPDGRYAGTAAVRNADGTTIGAVRIEFTTSQIGTHFELYRTEYIIGVILILVALVFASWFLARRLAKPIGLMVRAARAVEDGRQPEPGVAASLRNTSLTRDEYGELAGVFLDMAREVGAREIQLNALVDERTVELSEKNRALEDAQREIRNDLEMAHSVQAALVPADLPEDPRAGVAAYMTPALDVGGDFYDAFLTDDGRLAFAIADVSGKGVA